MRLEKEPSREPEEEESREQIEKEPTRKGIEIIEDEITKEHLKSEKEIAKEIFGNTSEYSFPETHEQILEMGRRKREQNPTEPFIIIDIGCSYGDNTISLAKKFAKEKISNVYIIGLDRCSWRINDAKIRHFVIQSILKLKGIYLTFNHRDAFKEILDKKNKKPVKADIIKVTDLSKTGFESFALDHFHKNLKENGVLFYSNVDIMTRGREIDEKGKLHNIVYVTEFGKKGNVLERFLDRNYNFAAPGEVFKVRESKK